MHTITSFRVSLVALASLLLTSNFFCAGLRAASGPIVISLQPADVSVSQSNAALFSVEVAGSTPYFYQWLRAGATIANATNASYTLPSAALSDDGAGFSVVVSNSINSVTSRVAVLTVYNGLNIGSPARPGSAVPAGNGLDITGGGTDIGTLTDQFFFDWHTRTGDFDVKVRVESLDLSDAWAKAGLMAREDLNTTNRYAAVWSTPNISGVFFQYRSRASALATNAGYFPASYPNTWLRLQRAGNVFTGFASFDGQSWSQLGSVSLTAMPGTIYLGMAVTSRNSSRTTTARFRDLGDVVGAVVRSVQLPREPLGPSSRRTGLAITEVMYHPREIFAITNGATNQLVLEYIELFNSLSIPENIGGYRLSGDIDYTFPTNTIIPPGGLLVAARVAAEVQAYYGITGVLGYGLPFLATNVATNVVQGITNVSTNVVTDYSNGLPNDAGTIRLRGRADEVLLEINYQDRPPWPRAADGYGHSLVLARPSYGEGNPKAWEPSDAIDGSPGRGDPMTTDPLRNVLINEILAHTDPPLVDYVELYNHSSQTVDLSGCYLSENRGALFDPAATNIFQIPPGTNIPPHGFVVFDTNQLGFPLSAQGNTIYLANSTRTRIIDIVQYGAQDRGISVGRYPDGAPSFHELSSLTPGAANSALFIRDVVINELMYNPISGNNDDEYIELYNKGTNAVNIGAWQFTSGISYTFPSNTFIPPDGYLVVAKNAANLFAKYPNLNANNTFGNYSGSLANGGERVTLSKPLGLAFGSNYLTAAIVADEVTYGDSGRWTTWSDGGGSSLELMDPHSDNRLASNWADSDETAKSSNLWTTIQFIGPLGESLGSPINDNLQVFLLGIGECLVDDLEVRNLSNTNANLLGTSGTFEAGFSGWVPQGSHDLSTIENTGYNSTRSLHVRAGSRGDNGANRVRSPILSPSANIGVVIRGKARWLRGWPEVIFRVHGGTAEATSRLAVPPNLGTPGARNSRWVGNIGPAIFDVTHTPVLPAANETVVVTARALDPDGVASVQLKYRVDPAATYTSINMLDNGTAGDDIAGDGIYSATLPGRASGLVAFYLQATDTLGATNLFPRDVFPPSGLARVFPNDSPTRECVVRWEEVQLPGSFATYHLWVTAGTSNRWTSRLPVLNNANLDCTFVYNNYRVVYNTQTRFAGSPWHRGQMTTGPAGSNRNDYDVIFPEDDKLLGNTDFVLNTPGNPSGSTSSDLSAQAEQASYIIFKEIGVHYNNRRYIHLFVNGVRRSISGSGTSLRNFIMEDSQQPNGDVIEEWFRGDEDGEFYKIEDWFEFPDNGQDFSSNNDADLSRRTILQNNVPTLSLAPYRFMWRRRSVSPGDSANNYSNFLALVDAVSPQSNPNSSTILNVAGAEALADLEQWLRIFACQHTIGNWDSYGYERGKNAYMYKGLDGRFQQMTWDIDFTMGVDGHGTTQTIFDVNDPRVNAMWNTPVLMRAFWRAFKDIVNGPLNNSFMDPILDAKAAAFTLNSVNYNPTVLASQIKPFISGRRTYLLGQIPNPAFAITTPTNNFTAASNVLTLAGTAPMEIKSFKVNGLDYPVTWSGSQANPSAWTIRLPLQPGSNALVVQAFDRLGNLMTNFGRTLTVSYPGQVVAPEQSLVFNEIMYNPVLTNASYVELFNTHSNYTFDLSNWKINGLGYDFPVGSLFPPRSFLILAKNRTAFATAFGAAPVFDEFAGNLDLEGDTLSLMKAVTVVSTNTSTGQAETNLSYNLVNRVRYEPGPPWPSGPNGFGPSLQLIDMQQDNSRVSNWTDRPGWRYASLTGTIQGSTNLSAQGTNVFVFMSSAGDLYVDDIVLVAGNVAEAGPNLLLNGDFESPLSGPWAPGGNHSNSVISTTVSHSGQASLHIISSGIGAPSAAASIRQAIPGTTNNYTATLSYWYLPSTNASVLTLRTAPGSAMTSTNVVRFTSSTPGAPNSVATPLPPYPPLWLNEVQAQNLSGITDITSLHEPWIELYNAGTNALTLDGYYLSDNYTNLTAWAFAAGSTIGAGEFKVIFADGQPGQSTASEWHTGFRLVGSAGSVALSRLVGGRPQIMDYLNWTNLAPNQSYGDFPDGQPFVRDIFGLPSPGTTNTLTVEPVAVFINEWMASNIGTLTNACGQYADWIELYNAGTNTVDLSRFYLTDTLTNQTKWRIPNGTSIPAHGYLLIWADNQNCQIANDPERHASFQLSAGGEEIGLYAPDGETLVDGVVFGSQTNDVSQGRFPDGSGILSFMTNATPRGPNVVLGGSNTQPSIPAIAQQTIDRGQTLSLTISATDTDSPPQTLTFSLDSAPDGAILNSSSGAFQWTPAVGQAPSTNVITVRVTDSGNPPLSAVRSLTVVVNELNPAPVIGPIAEQTVDEGATLSFTVPVTDPDPTQTLAFSLDSGAPAGVTLNMTSGLFTWTPDESQGPGFYIVTVRVTDDGDPVAFASRSISLTVNEVNAAPVIVPITDQTVSEGDTLTFTVRASDTDLPGQDLIYSLEPGAPQNAGINGFSGVFTFTPSPAQSPSTNLITVRVTDNGSPTQSSARSFTVFVGAPPVRAMNTAVTDGIVSVNWQTHAGKTYQLQFKNSLNDALWQDLGASFVAGDVTTPTSDTVAGRAQRFYRLVQLD